MDSRVPFLRIRSLESTKEVLMGELVLFVATKAKAGKRDAVRMLYEEMMAPRALENDAQEVVVWCADLHDPDAFFRFEIYSDLAAMGASAQADWFAEYMAKAGPLLAGEPSVTMGAQFGRIAQGETVVWDIHETVTKSFMIHYTTD